MDSQTEDMARVISRICGWLYFIAWSVSFYPQPALNFRRRTTEGLTLDFAILNVFGFTCYTISTVAFLYSPVVQAEYAARHPASPEPTVRGNDLAFGLHACVFTMLTLSQFWPKLWGWKQGHGITSRPNKVTLGLLWGGILGIAVCIAIVLINRKDEVPDDSEWGWIDVMYALTFVKLLATIFKYIPQVIVNHRRRSTLGWSIGQVLLDSVGGILSLVQLLIDSSLQADWSGLSGNPVKFGLANISLLFDIVFLTQHYILYGPMSEESTTIDSPHESGTETDPLLE